MVLRFTLRQLDFFVADGDAGSIGAEITNVRYWLQAAVSDVLISRPLLRGKRKFKAQMPLCQNLCPLSGYIRDTRSTMWTKNRQPRTPVCLTLFGKSLYEGPLRRCTVVLCALIDQIENVIRQVTFQTL